jgi:hypothetical protein
MRCALLRALCEAAACCWLKRPLLLSADAARRASFPDHVRTESACSPPLTPPPDLSPLSAAERVGDPPSKPRPAALRRRSRPEEPREVEPSREDESPADDAPNVAVPAAKTLLLAPAASVPKRVSAVRVDADCAADPLEKSKPPPAAPAEDEEEEDPPTAVPPRASLSRLDVRARPPPMVDDRAGSPGAPFALLANPPPPKSNPCIAAGARPNGEGTNCPKSNPLRTGEPGAEADPEAEFALLSELPLEFGESTFRRALSPTW